MLTLIPDYFQPSCNSTQDKCNSLSNCYVSIWFCSICFPINIFFRQKEKTLKDLKDQISMFQQTLTVKDQLIMDLTNKIHELSNNSFDIFDQDKTTGYCKPFPNCPKYLTVERKELQRLCVSISFFVCVRYNCNLLSLVSSVQHLYCCIL